MRTFRVAFVFRSFKFLIIVGGFLLRRGHHVRHLLLSLAFGRCRRLTIFIVRHLLCRLLRRAMQWAFWCDPTGSSRRDTFISRLISVGAAAEKILGGRCYCPTGSSGRFAVFPLAVVGDAAVLWSALCRRLADSAVVRLRDGNRRRFYVLVVCFLQ